MFFLMFFFCYLCVCCFFLHFHFSQNRKLLTPRHSPPQPRPATQPPNPTPHQHRTTEPPNHPTPDASPHPTQHTTTNTTPDQPTQPDTPPPHPKAGRSDRRRGRGRTTTEWRRRIDSRLGREEVANPLLEGGREGGANHRHTGGGGRINSNVFSFHSKKGDGRAIQIRQRKEAPPKGGGGRQHLQKKVRRRSQR